MNLTTLKKLLPSAKPSPFIYALLILCVILSGSYFRITGLDKESLFMDEIYQVSSYGFPLSKIIDGAARQQQPPLDYYIGHFVFLFNNSDVAARLPAALFGISSIVLILTLLWKNTNPPIALFCAMLYALSPFHIYYSQEARPYAIAILLFLLLFQTIVWLEEKLTITQEKHNHTTLYLLTLSLVEFLFLLSRLLSPLCVFTMLNLFFLFRTAVAIFKKERTSIRKNALYLLSALLAFICYLPFLFKLYESAQRYMDQNASTNLILSGITNFSLIPVFEAFLSQFDPLGWPALIAVLSSFTILIYSLKKKTTPFIFSLSAYLLISVLCLHLFIFLGKTSSPFRPPYAIYIQPLAIILIGYLILKLNKIFHHTNLLIFLGILFLSIETNAAITSKAMIHRTEWKQLIGFINKNLGPDYLTIFDSLTSRNSWKPYDWGRMRYSILYPTINLPVLNNKPDILINRSLKPVLVYFYYRSNKLLPTSRYPIHPNSGGIEELNTNKLKETRSLKTQYFNGLVMLGLKHYTGNTVQDTYTLIRETTNFLPFNETLIDSLLLAHELEIICPLIIDQTFHPLQLTKKLAQKNDWQVIHMTKQRSAQLKAVCQ